MRGKVPGGVHPAVGQEATAVGAFAAALAPGDTVSAPHRGHHHALAKGVSPDGLMAELYGKATEVSRGRGGSITSPASMLVSSDPMGSWGPRWALRSATPSLLTTATSNASLWPSSDWWHQYRPNMGISQPRQPRGGCR